MKIPEARGAASAALFEVFRSVPRTPEGERARAAFASAVGDAVEASASIIRDEDLQLTLFCLYELAYSGIDEAPDLEWDPALIAVRSEIEAAFEAELRTVVPLPPRPEPTGADLAATLFEMTAPTPGPSLSRFVAKQATDAQLHEFLVQRSVYTLKEADPHSWAIPRLRGRAKAALVEIQADEYGGGRPQRIHAEIFALALRGAGLSDEYGRYVDHVPAITLASLNQMSMFGLHRRLLGAVVGHLAAYEMTSSVPNRMYGNGFRRLGYDEDVTWYFDEHVEADAVHEQIASRDLAGGLVDSNPELLDDILFGASASLVVDGWVADHILSCWTEGRSSLRVPLVVSA